MSDATPPLQRDISGPSGGSTDADGDSGGTTEKATVDASGNQNRGYTPVWQTLQGPQRVFKRSVERRARVDPALRRRVENAGGVPKPYDPVLLKDVAAHPVAQAYIDTLAQDVAAAEWSLVPRDEDASVSTEERIEAQRKIEDLHPEKSFRDILEQTTRNTLELGDSAWVKHYYTDGELAEAVPVDSTRLYKDVDEYGLTRRYLETRYKTASVGDPLDADEVVWFEWSSRPDHFYGYGPVEKGLDVIQLLEELSEKELNDLMEGMPPGIIAATDDADNPISIDEFENVKEEFEMSEGERHRILVSRGQWDYTDFAGNYEELQILERNKFWIHVLGAVFKCNAPYAGFDFQEGNRAQNEAQHDAYAQRGFRQTLRRLEESITRQLVHPDISEELDFRFEREQSVEDRREQADLLEQTAKAAAKWASMGRTVTVDSEGGIMVEDGEVTEDDVANTSGFDDGGGQPGGGGGGEDDEVALEVSDPEAVRKSLRDTLDALSSGGSVTVKSTGGADAVLETFIEAGAVLKDADVSDTLRDDVETMFSRVVRRETSLDEAIDTAKSEYPAVDGDAVEAVLTSEFGRLTAKALSLLEDGVEHPSHPANRHETLEAMTEDSLRTKRQREVESCFGEALPDILRHTIDEAGSKAGAVRRISDALEANGYDGSFSRPTLYSWLRETGVDEES